MRRRSTLIMCLALVASLTGVAEADPIMGSAVLTVEPSNPAAGFNYGFPTASVYSSGLVDLSNSPLGLTMTGPPLGLSGDPNGDFYQTTFDLKITFDGASGTQPTIDVTGSLSGYTAVFKYQLLPSAPPGWDGTAVYGSFGYPTSATVSGWTPDSGIPMSLINRFLETSQYMLGQQYNSMGPLPTTAEFVVYLLPVPEPSTVLVYLVALAGLGMRRGARFWLLTSPR